MDSPDRDMLTMEQRAILNVIERSAFDRGARAMQQRILSGIRRWWSAAQAGSRHPGHPHHLEVRIAALEPEELGERP